MNIKIWSILNFFPISCMENTSSSNSLNSLATHEILESTCTLCRSVESSLLDTSIPTIKFTPPIVLLL